MEGGPAIALASFVARVPAITDEGVCQEFEAPIRGEMNRVVAYVMGTGDVRRRVMLFLNEKGERLRYDEVRGDLKMPGTSTAPAVDISLDFVKGTAQAANRARGRVEVANGTLVEGLLVSNLDMPQHMIDLIEQRCLRKK